MLRALIIDDEPLARSNIAHLLARDPAMQLAGQCGSAEEALELLPAALPDLVFLDIEMPECDGFELLERIGAAPPFAIVFVTAHHQFALRAFEVGALDYLLKPFDDLRFERVLERIKERLRVPGETRRFIIKNGNALDVVKFADIDWIEASDYYTTLHAAGRRPPPHAAPQPGRPGRRTGAARLPPHSPLRHRQPRARSLARTVRRGRVRSCAGCRTAPAHEPPLP